ncbi:hypothetical protein Pmar_PMAR006523 [Perkinsus marinus ATCC 50983]|uniref:Uncharacterized protein n=1 Tax=Perkinsus marinus (strain ATCC 50983 / TXsc) TaxID=423536 RepID=C5LTN9_PERM5|nr:hypothetical protein Pmar_PMAR006523 [Perkinsus marinus ATCC 50983]EEQ99851.1 hypothetical protein Pmar_PMAR006523 [Perkinsus marinus ATCC 50983]|eukprot:XP_002767134.1 hypothetical protein Pmar_PMAR006523 [Perkinsus marinus ATCC 50983]
MITTIPLQHFGLLHNLMLMTARYCRDDDQRRQCGRSVHDAQRVITDEEGGVLWSLKQNLMNR